ncbi:MAG: O-antigen ligase family protein [Phycisphaerales bacterium]|nr:O-antigen ligase family protein [Phycisphaerales bacterium]
MIERSKNKRDLIAVGSMCVLVVLVLIRAMSSHEPFPMWDSDPYVFSMPLTGITSGYGILLNACVMVLSVVILVCLPGSGRADSLMRLLLGIGSVGLGVHLVLDPANMVNGSTLGAMMAAMIASRGFLMAHPKWISVFVPIVLGAGVFLGVYGFHQVFIQHPLTVAMYDQNKEAFLNARGWSDGSFEVMSYERRLRQPEPTGWFGLANVYASFVAAFGIAMLMVTQCSIRKAWWMVSGLIAGLLLAILLVSKSKGGIGAAVLGFGIIQYALARHRGRPSRVGTSTLWGCVLVMGGVVGGALMHQLSLLFRGQYMVGSMRIFAENPILGVGPGKFQDAYMVHKPSTSPEDVTSAHNLLFDLIAQMGLAGIAWVGALVILIWSARLPKRDEVESDAVPRGVLVRMIPLMVLVVGVGVIRLQTNAMDLELMLLLLAGVGLWMGVSVLLGVFGSLRTLQMAAMSAGVVLVIHSMLDLTPVWIVSGPLFGLCLGLGFRGILVETSTKMRRIPNLVAAGGLGFVVVMSGIGATNVIARDQRLIELGRVAQEIAELRSWLQTEGPSQELADRVSAFGGIVVRVDGRSINESLRGVELRDRVSAAQGLIELAGKYDDPKLTITALEQAMKAAMILDAQGGDSGAMWVLVKEASDRLGEGDTFGELKWAGQGYITLARRGEDFGGILELAMSRWVRADALNPHDPKHAVRVMELALEMGNPEEASDWARKAIERSDRMRLDPLKQLSPEVLRRAQGVANSE